MLAFIIIIDRRVVVQLFSTRRKINARIYGIYGCIHPEFRIRSRDTPIRVNGTTIVAERMKIMPSAIMGNRFSSLIVSFIERKFWLPVEYPGGVLSPAIKCEEGELESSRGVPLLSRGASIIKAARLL